VSLEEKFWKGLREIANSRNQTLSCLIGNINAEGSIRLFVLSFYRDHRIKQLPLASSSAQVLNPH
jgi:predicted DNA-binding ribbon-helix-helix protein